MKNLVKFSFVVIAAVALASCGKTEFEDVSPNTGGNVNATKIFHTGSLEDPDGNGLFTDKDKCKKCHSAPKLMGIDWNAPYMSDNRYGSIEDMINNFDFVNNVHLNAATTKTSSQTISETNKQELINYLKGMAAQQESEASVK